MGGEFSHENFYQATTVSTSISRTLNQANTTVAGGYSFSWNRPQLHPDEIVENQAAHSAFATLTQTLSKYTIVQLGYELGSITGYQSNPFLRTTVDGVKMVGVHPDERMRHALTARLRQALPADTYLEADFRRYFDDWDVKANTWSVGLSHEFDPRVTLSGIYRRHAQQGAYFYQPSYTGSPEFYTADFRLFPFDSNLFTGRLIITPQRRFDDVPRRHVAHRAVRVLQEHHQLRSRYLHAGRAHAAQASMTQRPVRLAVCVGDGVVHGRSPTTPSSRPTRRSPRASTAT